MMSNPSDAESFEEHENEIEAEAVLTDGADDDGLMEEIDAEEIIEEEEIVVDEAEEVAVGDDTVVIASPSAAPKSATPQTTRRRPIRAGRKDKHALVIIYAGLVFLVLICLALLTYKLPGLLPNQFPDRVWPWSKILPPLEISHSATSPRPHKNSAAETSKRKVPSFLQAGPANEVDTESAAATTDDLAVSDADADDNGDADGAAPDATPAAEPDENAAAKTKKEAVTEAIADDEW
jgi:hypothetical protein